MIDFKCEHYRNDDGCKWCDKFHHFICDLCHKDDDDILDRQEC